MNKKLLILNLGVDSENTSLAFTQKWINEISLNFSSVDVLTMRVGSKYQLNDNVNLFFINEENSNYKKFYQLKKLFRLTKKLINENNYSHCFAHMAPLQHLIAKYYLLRRNIKTTLWFTHTGPKFGIKWLILWFSALFANNVVTASKHSFPFKFKKVKSIGHGINYDIFFKKRDNFQLRNILILSRVSKSKNIENTIDNITKCRNFKNFNIDVIGGTLNSDDEDYFNDLLLKYKNFKNINFLGKQPHEKLPGMLDNYDININNAEKGFFDKAVLETCAAGLINFYRSDDFDFLYSNDFQNILKFKKNNLYKKIDELNSYDKIEIAKNIEKAQEKTKIHSTKNVVKNLIEIFNQ
tara:strand:- start:7316 stop:8374 length:1059 start_codon:yes stop_codon:yes gene_type:complete